MNETIKNTETKIKKYIEDNHLIAPNDTIIIGLSGGADSVCLLLILDKLRKELDYNIEAIHVNHGIRGLTADLDEEFVINLCKNHNIPIRTYKENIPAIAKESHETEEECGRRIRYEIFKENAKEDTCKIAVAHHMEDQAETVIFRMARGTGIKGISGMRPKDGNIIRPLLCMHKREIVEYLKACEEEYRTDETNDDTLYSRNLIRKEITPLLERINEGAVDHIVSLSIESEKISKYIESQAKKLLEKAKVEDKYDAKIIAEDDEVIRTAAIRHLIKNSDIPLKDVSREHIERIDSLLTKSEASLVNLPRGVCAVIEAGKIYMASNKEHTEDDFIIKITGEGQYKLVDGRMVTARFVSSFDESLIPQSPYTKWFDYDKICNDLCIRTRQSGDYLVVGSKGEKKSLKEYMINEKIPKSERDATPILVNGNRVAWVLGRRISWDVKVTNSTKHVIEITIGEV